MIDFAAYRGYIEASRRKRVRSLTATGTGDDASYLQRLIDSGRKVSLPDEIYTIATPLFLRANTHLEGEGMRLTTIRGTSNDGMPLLVGVKDELITHNGNPLADADGFRLDPTDSRFAYLVLDDAAQLATRWPTNEFKISFDFRYDGTPGCLCGVGGYVNDVLQAYRSLFDVHVDTTNHIIIYGGSDGRFGSILSAPLVIGVNSLTIHIDGTVSPATLTLNLNGTDSTTTWTGPTTRRWCDQVFMGCLPGGWPEPGGVSVCTGRVKNVVVKTLYLDVTFPLTVDKWLGPCFEFWEQGVRAGWGMVRCRAALFGSGCSAPTIESIGLDCLDGCGIHLDNVQEAKIADVLLNETLWGARLCMNCYSSKIRDSRIYSYHVGLGLIHNGGNNVCDGNVIQGGVIGIAGTVAFGLNVGPNWLYDCSEIPLLMSGSNGGTVNIQGVTFLDEGSAGLQQCVVLLNDLVGANVSGNSFARQYGNGNFIKINQGGSHTFSGNAFYMRADNTVPIFSTTNSTLPSLEIGGARYGASPDWSDNPIVVIQ